MKQLIHKIIFTMISVGLVCVCLIFLLFEYQPNEMKNMDEVKLTIINTASTIKSMQKSSKKSVEKPTEKPTEPSMQASTTESTEVQSRDMWLIDISNPDYNYTPQAISLTDGDRELIATVVMHEFGDGGYIACCLQAQAFRDAMAFRKVSATTVYHDFQYDAYLLTKTPNKDCYDAVDYIFAGNMAVPHRVMYMYDTNYCTSAWHESQKFVVEYKGIRFFDAK